MEVTSTIKLSSRQQWRDWLAEHHATETVVWLPADDRPEESTIAYLDSVEEALCFSWIDGLAKRISPFERAQRFTPRRERSNWTDLNKQRARRLIKDGLMTDAGKRTLPDLLAPFKIANDIIEEIQSAPGALVYFQELPDLYFRVRIGYIEEMRNSPAEFKKRLRSFIAKTVARK